MIAARNHFPARTGIPQLEGPRAALASRHAAADTFARAGKGVVIPKGSDDGSRTTPRQVHGEDEAS